MFRLLGHAKDWLEENPSVVGVPAFVIVGFLLIVWLQDQPPAVRVTGYVIAGFLAIWVALFIISVTISLVLKLWLRYGRSPRAVTYLIRRELPDLDYYVRNNRAYVDSLIAKAQRALRRYEGERPLDDTWAELHYATGVLYASRRTGNRDANLELALHHYNRALGRYAGSPESEGWIRTNSDLGFLYRNRIRGEQADNIETAIHHGRIALEARTRKVFPRSWWATVDLSKDILRRRLPGEHANIDALVTDLIQDRRKHNMLHVEDLDLMDDLNGWARSQNNMGAAYSDRVQGDRAENIEIAIHHYKQALQVVTPTFGRQDWANAQTNLGCAYTERIRGSRADNLELAISNHQEALRIFSNPLNPEDWALTHHNLASAYVERIRGDYAENIEQSLQHSQQAMTVYSQEMYEMYVELRAAIGNTLGSAYTSRIRGDREENIERAIGCFEESLEVVGRSSYPMVWARTHAHLGSAYVSRIKGDSAANLDLAIDHCQLTLQVITIDSAPQEWALVQNTLGGIYSLRVWGDRVRNLKLSIFHLQEAMRIHTAESFPEAWANIQSNLGGAHGYLISEGNINSLQLCVHHCYQALEVFTQNAFPKDWARVHNNLGMDYYGAMLLGAGEYVEEIVYHFRQSLLVRTPRLYPQDCRDTAYSLGCVLYDRSRFSEAREALVTAHEAVEALRGELVRDKSKRAVSDENADLYARLVNCCLIEGDMDEALQFAVAGKGRSFVDTLASARIDLSAVGADDPQLAEDIQKGHALRKQIDTILSRMDDDADFSGKGMPNTEGPERSVNAQLSDKLIELQTQYAEHWDAMTYRYPALSATQVAPAVSASDARNLASCLEATLVEYFRHAEGWCAFVVTPSAVRHVTLPLLDDQFLGRMRAWVRRVADKKSDAGRNKLSYEALHRLHEAVIAPLNVHLARGQTIIMAPFGDLNLVPLNAARNRDTERYVWEDYNLSFAPSIAALHISLLQTLNRTDRVRQGPARRVLSVVYPGTLGSLTYLPGVLEEARVIEGQFDEVIVLHEKDATPNAVVEQACGQDIIHFGCHGEFKSGMPSESGLMLSGGWLTVQRIVTELRLDGTHLATVAACESGQMALSRGEEHIGLLQALMTAGAQTVVASLWSVDDESTRALLQKFYAGVASSQEPARALVDAAMHIRQMPGWEHPYHWAAFQANGLPGVIIEPDAGQLW